MTPLRFRLGTVLLALIPVVVLGIFFVLPVLGMLDRGLRPMGEWDLGAVVEVLQRPRIRTVMWFTAWSALATTLFAVVVGLPTAFALYRLRLPGRRLLRAMVMVPFVMPTVVVGVAFEQLLDEGWLGWLGWHGTGWAIVVALVFFNISVVVRTVGSYWESLDVRRAEAAAALGASPIQVFFTVTLPALAPAIVSAASVVFLFCATSFGVVLVMGGLRYANIETEIYQLTTQELDLTGAAALSVCQLLLITVQLIALSRLRNLSTPVERVTAVRGVRRGDAPLLAATGLVVAFLSFPMLSLLAASLTYEDRWSLRNYTNLTVITTDLPVSVAHALATSLVIALQAVCLAMVMGLIVSFVVSRPGGVLIRIFDGLFMLPLGVSAVTLGFGFLVTLNRPPLDLRSSAILIPIAQGLVALPLVVRTIAPLWRSIDPRQREAAASLGASPTRVFATVDLSVAWRPILAAAGFAFAVSLGEFGATSFLSREGDPTLPVLIYRLMSIPHEQAFGMAVAASVVLAAATATVMLVVDRLRVNSMGAF